MKQQSKKRMHRRAIMPRSSIFSMVAILMSLALTVATTFALAYRTITTSSSVIATGTFDVEFCLLHDGATVLEEDESWSVIDHNTAIFTCNNWQQSCTVVEVLRVTNNGSIPLKWKAALIPASVGEETEEADLTDVIDVYYAMVDAVPEVTVDANTGVTTCDLSGWTHAGTLRELLDGKDWDDYVIRGEATSYVAVALKMQEDANADYLGLNASFAFKFLAVQAVATDDQWPSVEGETVPAPEDSTPSEATEAVTEPAHEPAEPTETTAAVTEPVLEPETTAAPEPPVEPASSGVYRASAEQVADGASLESTRLGQAFVFVGADGALRDGAYHLSDGELRAATTEPYAFSITPTSYDSTFDLYVRSNLSCVLTGENWQGDGIRITVSHETGKEVRIGVTDYSEGTGGFSEETGGFFSTSIKCDMSAGDRITIADDGEYVYILTNDILRAVIRMEGSVNHSSGEVFVDDGRKFVELAYIISANDNTFKPCGTTTVASSVDAYCGVVTDGAALSFSEIAICSYDDVETIINPQLADMDLSPDPS